MPKLLTAFLFAMFFANSIHAQEDTSKVAYTVNVGFSAGNNVADEPSNTIILMNGDDNPVNTIEEAVFIRTISHQAGDSFYNVTDVFTDGRLRAKNKALNNNWRNLSYIGDYVEYYPSGKTHIVKNYQNGVIWGTTTEYFEDGAIKLLANYKNGMLVDDVKSFYPTGKLHTIKRLDDNKWLVMEECRDSTGNILAKKGKGRWIEYDNDYKKIIKQGEIRNGRRNGTWTIQIVDSLKTVVNYSDGMLGSGVSYHDNGKKFPFKYENEHVQSKSVLSIIKKVVSKYVYLAERDSEIAKIIGNININITVSNNGLVSDVEIKSVLPEQVNTDISNSIKAIADWEPAKYVGYPIEGKLEMLLNYYKLRN